ncbi:MAG: glycoside hydrolase family 95 protein, partial [Candidatus Aminicenantes bacterium]|nr:glycoside hydrolase family 95 protein [Candidatus Aminicenantes bacterium]NIQ72959.1 glycoside hydrolase family 95 protein [Candidatus Aminicenantes bacterium]NIT28994.1 glycoside hydrolase family 95 protein [Candidatus Aminicenantes bacterium]
GKDTLIMRGQVGDYTEGRTKTVRPSILKFESRLMVINEGGNVSNDEHGIYVKKANAATVVLAAATSYVNYVDVSGDPAQRCCEVLNKIKGKSYQALRKRHIKDHRRLFRRVSFDLGTTKASRQPTDERIKNFSN